MDWSGLPTDLEEYSIDLLEEQKWQGFIRATNEDTNNECYFFELDGEENIRRIQFFIPNSIFFYDYEMFFYFEKQNSWRRWLHYYSKADYFPSIPEIVEDNFSYEVQDMNKYSFEITFDKIQDEVNFTSFEDWQVIARNVDQVEFEFPILSGSVMQALPSLRDVKNNKLYRIVIKQINEGESEIRFSEEFNHRKNKWYPPDLSSRLETIVYSSNKSCKSKT